jgi:hypothetical protein
MNSINFFDRYDKNEEAFHENVKLCVKASQEQVYDPPPTDDDHYITFEPYDHELHGPIRESIFKVKVCLCISSEYIVYDVQGPTKWICYFVCLCICLAYTHTHTALKWEIINMFTATLNKCMTDLGADMCLKVSYEMHCMRQ